MSRILGAIAVVVAAVVALVGVAAALVASVSVREARDAVVDAQRLLAGRIAVARAERALGDSDVDEAIAAAGRANQAARWVGALTARIVRTLGPIQRDAAATTRSARRALAHAVAARRSGRIGVRLLAAISAYQRAAASSNRATNAALRRALRALRRTNREFEP